MEEIERYRKWQEKSTDIQKYVVYNIKFSSRIKDYICESISSDNEGEHFFHYFTKSMLKRDRRNNYAPYFMNGQNGARCYIDEDSYDECMKDLKK